MDKTPKFRRHETFSIREGWLEKGINKIKGNNKCFSKEQGTRYLGLGTNMVKALKFWLQAANLASFNVKTGANLTSFGECLFKVDRYLENTLSLYLIHYYLVMDEYFNPIFYEIFHDDNKTYEKESLVTYLTRYYKNKYDIEAEKLIESDVQVFFKTYVYSEVIDPENNFNSPFSKLGFFKLNNKQYIKESPLYDNFSNKVILFVINKYLEDKNIKEFNLEDFINSKYSPLKIYNLTQSSLYAYLDELKNTGFISIVKTAGLNTIKLNKELTVEELYE